MGLSQRRYNHDLLIGLYNSYDLSPRLHFASLTGSGIQTSLQDRVLDSRIM